jgi:hypothetical protein
MADDAIELGEAILANLPAEMLPADATPGERLKNGLSIAIEVGVDICRCYRRDADLKERRLVSDTAAWIARLGVRVWEADMTARQSGENLSRVIAEVKAAARERERVKREARVASAER